ncbi:hypothetical protein EG329_005171 [Mollisiaceae sp. DMI_Dod_QoI]|nr:hypothetical protein EG329_005171 [Helotiales sp. DMI_Dod_QoI]
MASSPSLTLYGATVTTTITTSYTVSDPNQRTWTLLYPEPPITEPLQYTTLRPPSNPASKWFPTTLPVLVLTDVVGVLFNTNGIPLQTGTLNQEPPSQPTITGTGQGGNLTGTSSSGDQTGACRAWDCWSQSEQVGIIVGPIIGFLVILAILWWGFCLRRNGVCGRPGRHRRHDEEGGGRGGPGGGSRRGRRRSSSGSDSSSSSLSVGDISRSGITSIPPMGPMNVPAYRVTQYPRQRSPPRQNQYRPVRETGRPPPVPPPGTSAKDWAFPAGAAVAGAGIGAAHAKTRNASTNNRLPRRPPPHEGISRRETRDLKDPSSDSTLDDRNGTRRGESYRSRREAQDGRRGSSKERNFRERQARSRGRIERYKDFAREDKRSRSLSPPRYERSREGHKKKKSEGLGLKSFWAVLPFLLAAIYELSEPDGGWHQYHSKKKQRGRRIKELGEEFLGIHENNSSDRDRSPRRRARSVDSAYEAVRSPRDLSATEERRKSLNSRIPPYMDSGRSELQRPEGSYVRRSADAGIGVGASSEEDSVSPDSRPRRRRSTRQDIRTRRRNMNLDGV